MIFEAITFASWLIAAGIVPLVIWSRSFDVWLSTLLEIGLLDAEKIRLFICGIMVVQFVLVMLIAMAYRGMTGV